MAKNTPKKKRQERPTHPFEIGKEYRNRDGAYRVVSIHEPDMIIRYHNGRTVESPIVLQARIWENMQEDDGGELEFQSQ
jgi:hypothetical protein